MKRSAGERLMTMRASMRMMSHGGRWPKPALLDGYQGYFTHQPVARSTLQFPSCVHVSAWRQSSFDAATQFFSPSGVHHPAPLHPEVWLHRLLDPGRATNAMPTRATSPKVKATTTAIATTMIAPTLAGRECGCCGPSGAGAGAGG